MNNAANGHEECDERIIYISIWITTMCNLCVCTTKVQFVKTYYSGMIWTIHTFILNTGASQSCVLSPPLYSLYTHDCVAGNSSNSKIMFADDTVVIVLDQITNNNVKSYVEKVGDLPLWWKANTLLLNVSKTKKLVVDFGRKQQRNYTHLRIKKNHQESDAVHACKHIGNKRQRNSFTTSEILEDWDFLFSP